MATTVRSSSINQSSGTAVTVAAPAGTTAGDVVVVIVSCNGNTTIVDNNGSTPFAEDLNDFQEVVGGATVSVFSRRIVGGDPSTYAFTIGLSGRWTAVAIAFQSPHASVIYDVAPDTANSSAFTPNTTSPTSDDITTINANALHVIAVSPDGPATAVSGTPAGYTILQNGGDQTIAAGYKVIASPSATGVQTWTTALEDSITLSFAIRDEGAAAAPATPKPLTTPHFGRGKKPWSKLRTSPLSLVPAAGTADLSGSATLTFSPSGALQGDSALAGATTLTFSPSGALVGSSALVGATSLTFTPSATLLASALMSGATSLTFSPLGSLVGASALSGQTTLTFAPSAVLVGESALSGATSITFAPSGSLGGAAALVAATTLTFTVSGDLTALAASADLAGTTSLTFTPSGDLTAEGLLTGGGYLRWQGRFKRGRYTGGRDEDDERRKCPTVEELIAALLADLEPGDPSMTGRALAERADELVEDADCDDWIDELRAVIAVEREEGRKTARARSRRIAARAIDRAIKRRMDDDDDMMELLLLSA